jgi:GNAT superfamily N-acetyltransferase
MTHVMGMGLSGAVSVDELERMENFYHDRGSSCLIDLCPLADASVLEFVGGRPYRVIEFNDVLAQRIARDEPFEATRGLAPVPDGDLRKWSRVVSEGFSEHMPVSDEMAELMAATCKGAQCWVAGDDSPAGGAAMGIENGVALFYGDSILPAARGRGWQAGLIRERLAAAQRQDCDLAMVSVLPGSRSHRNYERAGFELIYTRVTLQCDFREGV